MGLGGSSPGGDLTRANLRENFARRAVLVRLDVERLELQAFSPQFGKIVQRTGGDLTRLEVCGARMVPSPEFCRLASVSDVDDVERGAVSAPQQSSYSHHRPGRGAGKEL